MTPVHRIVVQKIGKVVGGSQIVDGDDVQRRRRRQNLECGPPDPPQSIDRNVHGTVLSQKSEAARPVPTPARPPGTLLILSSNVFSAVSYPSINL